MNELELLGKIASSLIGVRFGLVALAVIGVCNVWVNINRR